MERMRIAIEEAKSAIHKAQEDMKRYYDRRRTPAPVFNPGDKVFLDASDIRITCPLQKILHRWLSPFVVERRIRPMAYCLKLPYRMKQLYPVFNVVVTNFIRPYLHQFSIDSHGLNGYGKPLKRPFDRYQSRLEAISNGRDIRQINW